MSRGVIVIRNGAGGRAPTVAQSRFNTLIGRLHTQRAELAKWRKFKGVYHQRLSDDYEPLIARLRERRIALARALDEAIRSNALNRREQGSVREILRGLLPVLLEQGNDPELVELHDKYSESSYGEEQQLEMEALRALAEDKFGIDLADYAGGESADELADWIEDRVRKERLESKAQNARKKNAKASALDPPGEPIAEDAAAAVRDIFRKLVSELHPDRETDPEEHARKTELMQRVNQAYKAADLLGLLELQLGADQIDSEVLGQLADARLRQYVHVFERQSRQMSDELAAILAPFQVTMGGAAAGRITPERVLRALDRDLREIKRTLRDVEAELMRFTDIGRLKQSLKRSAR